MWTSSHPPSARSGSTALSRPGACPWCGWCSSDLPTWLFPAAVCRREFSLQAEWKSRGQLLNGCCSSHPARKSCPVALVGEQLWALSQAWPWLEMEHLFQLLVSFQNLPGFACPPSPGRFCQPGCKKCRGRTVHLTARAEPWVNWEWEGEHGQQWGAAAIPCRDVHWDLLLSAQICFYGYRSERKKEKQKEKDSFTCKWKIFDKMRLRNWGSQHECCHSARLKTGRWILKMNNPPKYQR